MASSASSAATIYEMKRSFLLSQIRGLSTEITPPKNWQDELLPGPEGDLSDKAVEQAMQKLNTLVRKHNKLIYSSQALRHVTEQIDALYMDKSSRSAGGDLSGTEEIDIRRKGVDLLNPDVIDLLPESWPSDSDPSSRKESPEDLARYSELISSLTEASNGLQVYKEKHEYFKEMKDMVTPLLNPEKTVQPNMVTRDSELGAELEKMRTLALRLSVQIEQAKKLVRKHEGGQEVERQLKKKKVEHSLLDLLEQE